MEDEDSARKKEEKEKNLRKQLEKLRMFQSAAGKLFASDAPNIYAIDKARKTAFVENKVKRNVYMCIKCLELFSVLFDIIPPSL
jgi:hypothetical protein